MKPAPPVTRTGRRPAKGAEAHAPSCHETPHLKFLAGLVHAVLGFLSRDPLGEFGEALQRSPSAARSRVPCEPWRCRECNGGCRRRAPCRRSRARDPSRSMAAARARRPPRTGGPAPLAMLKTSPRRLGCSSAEHEGLGDVLDMHEVAPLLAVLEDQRRAGRCGGARRRWRARRCRGWRAPGRGRRR